jgi:signal transduction histidine kinase
MPSVTGSASAARRGRPAAGAASVRLRRWCRVLLRAPFSALTWRTNLYTVAGAVLTLPSALLVLASLAVGLSLAVTFLGLPLLALGGTLAIWLGGYQRALARRLLGQDIPAAAPRPRGRGVFGWLQASLTDPVAWRARLYLIIRLPLAFVSCYTAAFCYVEGVLSLSYPLWWSVSPLTARARRSQSAFPVLPPPAGGGPGPATHRLEHQLTVHLGSFSLDTWPRAVAVSVAGVLILLAVPWIVRGLARLDVALMRGLLGPTAGSRRVERLQAARSVVADDAAAALRRIERDLHDGTQAQLVALAMNLGAIRERLEDQPAATRDTGTLDLVTTAHDRAKDALGELRNIARGIHPPALDAGLGPALETLTARSAVPASLQVTLASRPDRAIETISYYAVAELLTNVARHSGADAASVQVCEQGAQLAVTVTDAGHGGADPGQGTGLRGLATRLDAVDGSLGIDSPAGGPTVISFSLPMRI